jgi:hypothetical protein
MFYIPLSKRRQLIVQHVGQETGEASFLLRVEISKAIHAGRLHIVFNSNS